MIRLVNLSPYAIDLELGSSGHADNTVTLNPHTCHTASGLACGSRRASNMRTTPYPAGGLCDKARDESAPAYVHAYDHNPANPPILVTQADFGCTMHEAQTA